MSHSVTSPSPSPSPTSSPSIQIWLMGSWRILQDGAPVDLPVGQPRTLLIYLLLQAEGRALRSTLVEQIWPDAPPDRARRYLTDALYRLRRALHPALINADPEQINLDLTQVWWVDLWEFQRLIASPDADERARGLTLYGELLPDLADSWLIAQRTRLHEQFVQTLLAAATQASQTADFVEAETFYRQLLSVDPLHEAAHRGIMQSLARRGRLAAALEQYDGLVDLLERELGVPPSPETRDLADQLFQELDLARRRVQTPVRPQMVGRVEERTLLRTVLERVSRGERGVVVILGEPGIGKTTLLRDLAQAAGWRGWQIHWGEAHEALPAAPYAPLTTALEKALPVARASQLAASLPAVWLNLLARLFPVLDQASPRRTEPRPVLPTAAFAASQMPPAVAQLLYALQTIAPLLLLLDDVQWGDGGLWKLLDALLPLITQQRVLLVLSARRDDLRTHAVAWAQLSEWDRTGVAQILALEGLPPAVLGELAALHPAVAQGKEALALHSASGGNPLLALEILAAETPSQLLAARPAVAMLIRQRFDQLHPQARQAAELAAILGAQVDYEQWAALWQQENPYSGGLAPHAAALEQAGVLRVEDEHYTFAHGLLHTAALADMRAADRQRRHGVALTIIAPETEADLSAAELLCLLHHAQEAKAATAAVRYALLAGQQALQAFSFAAAEAHFTLVLTQLDTDRSGFPNLTGLDPKYTALLKRSEARHLLADRSGEAADLATLRTLPLTDEQAITVGMRLAQYQLVTGDLPEAQATVTAALQQATTLGLGLAADLAVLAGRIARERNDLARAYAQIAAAQEHYRQANNVWGAALATDVLGGIAWDQGDYEQAAILHAQAAEVFAGLEDLVREAQALNNLGSTLWELGRYLEARTIHERSIWVCRELGNKLSEGDNIDNLGGVAWVLGDYALALRHYQAALQLRTAIDDQWGISISLSNLGSTYQMLGEYEDALDHYERSLALSEQVGRKRSAAYILHCQGQTRLAMGQVDEAWALLQQTLDLRNAIGDRLRLLETHSLLIQAALARGDLDIAQQQRSTALALLQPTDRAGVRQEVYYAAFCLAERCGESTALRFLALALQAQRAQADALPLAEQTRFLQNVPLNRAITAAATRHSQTQSATLAGSTGPVTLTWTLVHPEDSLIEEKSARRRQVLARLLQEAARHQATPTHDQLADALGVSRRTVLRDLPLLESTAV